MSVRHVSSEQQSMQPSSWFSLSLTGMTNGNKWDAVVDVISATAAQALADAKHVYGPETEVKSICLMGSYRKYLCQHGIEGKEETNITEDELNRIFGEVEPDYGTDTIPI